LRALKGTLKDFVWTLKALRQLFESKYTCKLCFSSFKAALKMIVQLKVENLKKGLFLWPLFLAFIL